MTLHDIRNAIVSQLFHSMASRFLLGFSYDIVRVGLDLLFFMCELEARVQIFLFCAMYI